MEVLLYQHMYISPLAKYGSQPLGGLEPAATHSPKVASLNSDFICEYFHGDR